jgi:hypothetical protein
VQESWSIKKKGKQMTAQTAHKTIINQKTRYKKGKKKRE